MYLITGYHFVINYQICAIDIALLDIFQDYYSFMSLVSVSKCEFIEKVIYQPTYLSKPIYNFFSHFFS